LSRRKKKDIMGKKRKGRAINGRRSAGKKKRMPFVRQEGWGGTALKGGGDAERKTRKKKNLPPKGKGNRKKLKKRGFPIRPNLAGSKRGVWRESEKTSESFKTSFKKKSAKQKKLTSEEKTRPGKGTVTRDSTRKVTYRLVMSSGKKKRSSDVEEGSLK